MTGTSMRYASGTGTCVAGPRTLLLLGVAPEHEVVSDVADLVLDGAGFLDVAGALARHGFDRLPALVCIDVDVTPLRALVRGDASIEQPTETDEPRGHEPGSAALTWQETVLTSGAVVARVNRSSVDATLSLVGGVVPADVLHLSVPSSANDPVRPGARPAAGDGDHLSTPVARPHSPSPRSGALPPPPPAQAPARVPAPVAAPPPPPVRPAPPTPVAAPPPMPVSARPHQPETAAPADDDGASVPDPGGSSTPSELGTSLDLSHQPASIVEMDAPVADASDHRPDDETRIFLGEVDETPGHAGATEVRSGDLHRPTDGAEAHDPHQHDPPATGLISSVPGMGAAAPEAPSTPDAPSTAASGSPPSTPPAEVPPVSQVPLRATVTEDPLDDAPTVHRAPRLEQPRIESGPGVGNGPTVQAVHCASRHPNPPHAEHCRACGQPITDRQVRTISRPALGRLRLPDGEEILLVEPVVLGRKPPEGAKVGGEPARSVRVPDDDKMLSRVHAEVRLVDWQIQVVDRDSMNHTFIELPGQAPLQLRPAEAHPTPLGAIINLADAVRIELLGIEP